MATSRVSRSSYRGTTLKGLVSSIGFAREANERKSVWLRLAFVAFFWGLAAAVAAAVAFTWQSDKGVQMPAASEAMSASSHARPGVDNEADTMLVAND